MYLEECIPVNRPEVMIVDNNEGIYCVPLMLMALELYFKDSSLAIHHSFIHHHQKSKGP